ncbi:DNA replication complex GINS family protein [Candidatus Woesearchaeota archaeon]|nr:MAG: DNA replication complex GINS family protein [Candidatus Woesearchaeota archaeon]
MVDIVITYETLFDVLRKEKGRDDLQQLPESFYHQVVTYLRKKKKDVEDAGGFGAAKAQRAAIQYRNIEKILRELYERRERKIIEMALNRARTESNLINTSLLLPEEREFFEQCADHFERFRKRLLATVIGGGMPEESVAPPKPEVQAAVETVHEAAEPPKIDEDGVCKVKFLVSVPRFLGLKGEVHGPYAAGEEAELPGKIASILVKKKRAEVVS